MGRKPAPQPLTLSDPAALGEGAGDDDQHRPGHQQPPGEIAAAALPYSPPLTSPTDARSPKSPRSPFASRFTARKASQGGNKPLQAADDDQPTSTLASSTSQAAPTSAPLLQGKSFDSPARSYQDSVPPPPSQPYDDGQQQPPPPKTSKSGFFFGFANRSKSSHQLHGHQHSDSRAGETMSRGGDGQGNKSSKHSDSSYADHSVQKPVPSLPSKSDLSLASTTSDTTTTNYDGATAPITNASSQTQTTAAAVKKSKPKPFGLLGRTKSIRDKDGPSPKERDLHPQQQQMQPSYSQQQTPSTAGSTLPIPIHEPEPRTSNHHLFGPSGGLKTASATQDRAFRDMMNSAVRNRSEDRAPRSHDRERDAHSRERGDHHNHHGGARTQPSSYRENGGSGSAFFSGLRSSGARAADAISKGLFGKAVRSGSTNEREPVVDDEHYVLKVINLPLIEQTRLTRISKRLEDSRDKTEFWMPAFPWRAIDYLNYKGSDVEGLYRVPGSGPQIKKWQRKFDEEYDVDLFAQDDLYDINIIGSMLKAWLRELPDELFPKEAQERISRECAGAETVPQMLIDELSNLSPFNYYLLFAITCHLSLLLAHADKNKMDFRNLCICFQPCMKIDAFCFKFLVCDWRDCWKGCKNEAKYIEEEYTLFDSPPPRGLAEPRKPLLDEVALPQQQQQQQQVPQVQLPSLQQSQQYQQSSPPPQQYQQTLQPPPPQVQPALQPSPQSQKQQQQVVDDRNISSSDSSKQSSSRDEQRRDGRLKKKAQALQLGESNGSVASSSTLSTTLTINSSETPRRSNDLRPLSPIKPLSPLGF